MEDLTAYDTHMTFHASPNLDIDKMPGDVRRNKVEVNNECETSYRDPDNTKKYLV